MSVRSQAREDAVVVLTAHGWGVERIRRALGITEVLAAQLVRKARPFASGAGCCYPLGDGRWCDAPVRWKGSVYCDAHHCFQWPERHRHITPD